MFKTWRAASNDEFNVLLVGLGGHIAFDARVIDEQIVIRANSPFIADEGVFYIYTFDCHDFPCITEHLQYYGDLELLQLLSGIAFPENFPEDYGITVDTPQAWVNACINDAELSAPGQRPVVGLDVEGE